MLRKVHKIRLCPFLRAWRSNFLCSEQIWLFFKRLFYRDFRLRYGNGKVQNSPFPWDVQIHVLSGLVLHADGCLEERSGNTKIVLGQLRGSRQGLRGSYKVRQGQIKPETWRKNSRTSYRDWFAKKKEVYPFPVIVAENIRPVRLKTGRVYVIMQTQTVFHLLLWQRYFWTEMLPTFLHSRRFGTHCAHRYRILIEKDNE